MAARRSYAWPTIIVIIGLSLGTIALPDSTKTWAPGFLRAPKLHYGLDLAGGTQLDFRISEEEMRAQEAELQARLKELESAEASPESLNSVRAQIAALNDQKQNIVEAIRTVLERRINALGVSEATITPSYIGSEKHLLVECPGVVDTQVCIETVGKTIQLEFKEEFIEATAEYEKEIGEMADTIVKRITQSGETLAVVGQDLSDNLSVSYIEKQTLFKDQLPKGLESIWEDTPTNGVQRLEGSISSPQTDTEGNMQVQEVPGIFLVEVLEARTETGRIITNKMTGLEYMQEREASAVFSQHENVEMPPEFASALSAMNSDDMQVINHADGSSSIVLLLAKEPGAEVMSASHILITYSGATSAEANVTRTEEEALKKAGEIKSRIDNGESFTTIAKSESDGPSAEQAGSLGTFGRGAMVPAFEAAAFALKEGEVSQPIKTQFGYHIIRSDKAPAKNPDHVSYSELKISGENAASRATALLTEINSGALARKEDAISLQMIFLSLLPTGWQDTTLDGKHFRSATVTLDQVTNLPTVQIIFDEEGAKLFQELTKKNIGKRIAIFVGGQLISAPTVQQEIGGGIAVITGSTNFEEAQQLATDLNTGAIPAPIYLAGQRTVEATLGAEALQTSLYAGLVGIIIVMILMIVLYRVLGFCADLALCVYAILLIAITKLPLFLFSNQYIVLTLAGMAGVILSIGMAVDANVLIFERIKEELRKGKLLKTAIEIGFQRAWPSIRDGNVSTLITSTILFMFGTSIVRGFAVTLGIGILLSMFTAIIVSRFFVRKIAETPLGSNTALFGVKREEKPLE